METCPVCDAPHAPGALECANCGRVFFAAADAAVAEARLPELETTALAAPGMAVPADAVPGLEVTSFAEVSARPAPAGEAVVGLETTASSPVGAVAVEPSGWEVSCPNCGATGQARGLYCNACGTRLSRPPDEDDIPMIEGVALDEDAPKRCKACGAMRVRDGLCLDCGSPVRA
jgi:hypothetical protein